MNVFLIILSAFLGFCGLALSLERHYRQVWQVLPTPIQVWRYRLSGWLLMLISLWLSTVSMPWSYGLVLWFGVLTPVACTVVLMLSYRPYWLRGSFR